MGWEGFSGSATVKSQRDGADRLGRETLG
jgi:hypothetical protein